jgi:hypothetical protein
MNVYEVALASKVTGTFRVIAYDLEEAKHKAQRMYVNGVDHEIDQIETIWARELPTENKNE